MGKGAETRRSIVDHAIGVAATAGLESLTIGTLASDLGMSKSGLFAHFNSKEQLQLGVLQEAVERFVAHVVVPALGKPRGEPRVSAMFDRWIDWAKTQPGGCIIHSASSELDDRPGVLRDFLLGAHRDLRDTVKRAAQLSCAEGHFRAELDLDQFAFEFTAIALGYHHSSRLLRDRAAEKRAHRAFASLVERARGA
jgi:AcrR family transcriptional regulator